MKTQPHRFYFSLATLALLAALNVQTVSAQGTAFTYQGRLFDGAGPANGKYDLRFNLYDAASVGSLVAGPLTNSPVTVSNGLFVVTLDFGAGVFTGPARWLDIGVRSNTVAVAFTTLGSRQQLTPTPYAIFAETANASGLSGTIPTAGLSGTYGSALTLNNPGNVFAGNGTGLTNVNAAKLGGLTAAQFWQLGGNAGTTPGVNYMGTPDGNAVEFKVNNVRALRLEPDLLSGFATPNVIGGSANFVSAGIYGATIGGGGGSLGPNSVTNNFGTVAGGVANTSGSQAAIGGGYLNKASGQNSVVGGGFNNNNSGDEATIGGGYGNTVSGYVATAPGVYFNIAAGSYSFAAGQNAQALNDGSFVWADDSSATPFASTANNQFLVRAGFMGLNRATRVSGNEYFGIYAPVTNNWVGMYIQGSNTSRPFYGYANPNGNCWTENDGTDGYKWKLYNGGYQLTVTTSGSVGIGTTSPSAALEVANGDVRIDNHRLLLDSGSGTNYGLLNVQSGLPGISFGNGPFLYGFDGGALGAVSPNTVCLSWDYSGNVWVSNNCSVATLSIRGGADLAEPFNITSGKDEVIEGAVVVIDDQNPGHLKLSNSPYDTHVAGVVSGANGVNPGIQMHQQGIIEGGKNVALTGRVYVQADAANGAIRPGDMLTTSSTPGHAMKVNDHAKAVGAILGKAMTGLSAGKGMVLVLVTLQ